MDARIKVSLEFSISESGLEDALDEYDELSVEGLISEIVDKSVACDDIVANVEQPEIGMAASREEHARPRHCKSALNLRKFDLALALARCRARGKCLFGSTRRFPCRL